MARAKPAVEFSGVGNGDASQVRTNRQDDNPFVGQYSIFVGFGITQTTHWYGSNLCDFLRCSFSNENGFATPLYGQGFAVFNRTKVEIGRGQGGSRGGNGEGGHQFDH
ncbi:unnamed protein product [Pseudo-nitzschia multistriata]|uniref:Uncharacterized protein n=1 Tax=Pseudo-nitzschia multistriata TaxID=183589 RepID=A0A448Z420_9STRA|nr:unnamed protein product [Pseudo-nitzschia multistriata]